MEERAGRRGMRDVKPEGLGDQRHKRQMPFG